MRLTARPTQTLLGQINPNRLVEAGARRIASRPQIRALLAQFLTRDRYAVEQFEIGESGIERIRVSEADLRACDAPSTPSATDDDEYSGD